MLGIVLRKEMSHTLHSFIIFVLICGILISCKEKSNPISSSSSKAAYLYMDFQGGFYNDQIEIYLDDQLRFSQSLSTDNNTNFADRLRIVTTPDSHDFKIKLNFSSFIIDTTLILLDSLFLGFINDTLYNKLYIAQFKSLPNYPTIEFNDFLLFNINYLRAEGYSNLMPPNRPDPVGILVYLEIRSMYDKKIISGIYPDEVFVYNLSTNKYLGNISMDYWSEIYLYPGHTDTVVLYKLYEDQEIFDTPCYDSLYLKINFRDQYYRGIQIETDPFFYDCDW